MADPVKLRIATCQDQGEAALIRAVLDGHGIAVHIAGEHHASTFGGLAGGLVPLHVWVDAEDAEPATELIRSLREDEVEMEGDDIDPSVDDELEASVDPRHAIEQRRRTGIVLLLSCVVTFGTGHLFAGAWQRAIALMAVEIYGWSWVGKQPALAFALVGGAIVLDLVGALVLVRRDGALPRARLVA